MASSIAAARKALYDLMIAAQSSTLAGVQVAYTPPVEGEEQQVVTLLGVADTSEDAVVLGAGRRDEEYVVFVGIKVHQPDSTEPWATEERAIDLTDIVAALVTANKTLNNTVLNARPAGRRSGDDFTPAAREAEGGGFVVFVTLRVACKARIA